MHSGRRTGLTRASKNETYRRVSGQRRATGARAARPVTSWPAGQELMTALPLVVRLLQQAVSARAPINAQKHSGEVEN